MNESMGAYALFEQSSIIFFLPSPLGGWLDGFICIFVSFSGLSPGCLTYDSSLLSLSPFFLGGRRWTKIWRYPTNGEYSNTQEAWQTFPPYTPSLTTLGVLFWCSHHVPIVRSTLVCLFVSFLTIRNVRSSPPPTPPSFLPTPLSGSLIRYEPENPTWTSRGGTTAVEIWLTNRAATPDVTYFGRLWRVPLPFRQYTTVYLCVCMYTLHHRRVHSSVCACV